MRATAHVHRSVKESNVASFGQVSDIGERQVSDNGQLSDTSKFANLLCDLLAEHHRCVREAALFAKDEQYACEPRTPLKMSAYLPSLGHQSARCSGCGLSAEEGKEIGTLQAHIQSTECLGQDFSQIMSSNVSLQPLRLPVPADPDDNCWFPLGAEMNSKKVCFKGVEQDEEPSPPQQQVDFVKAEDGQTLFVKKGEEQTGPVVFFPEPLEKEASDRGPDVENDSTTSPESLNSMHQNRAPVEFFESHKHGRLPSKNASGLFNEDVLPPSILSLKMAQLLSSPRFEVFCGSLIVINTLIMAAEMQYNGMKAGYATKYPTFDNQAHEAWPHAASAFVILEQIFTVIFTLELFFRISVLRRNWCKEGLNWMDFLFVLVSWLNLVYTEAGVMDPMMARLVRLARLSRGLRLAKLSTVTSSLHLLIKSVSSSVSILSWSVGILLVAQCISGMMLCQLVQNFVMDENEDLMARQRVFAYYGTFSRSMITMFEVHLANFGPACRILLDNLGEEYAYLFLAYRCFAGFAIINVINAVFVQQTIKVAEADQDVMLNQKRKAVEQYSKKVKAFFKLADVDGDGCLSEEELIAFEDNPTYQLWMSALDIEAADLRGLLRILDTDKEKGITTDELILGASRIKGPARSIDMVQVLSHLQKLQSKVDDLFKIKTQIDVWSRQVSNESAAWGKQTSTSTFSFSNALSPSSKKSTSKPMVL